MIIEELMSVISGEWVIEIEKSGVGYSIFMRDGWFSECEDVVNKLPPHLKGLIFLAIKNKDVACIRTEEEWKPRVVISL